MHPAKQLLFLLAMLFVCHNIYGQHNFWNKTEESNLKSISGDRWIVPKKYMVFSFNKDAMHRMLQSETATRSVNDIIMDFPDPDGKMYSYRMTETPVFDEELSKKYPGYTSFTGRRTDRSDAYLKMSVSPFSIHVMILQDGKGSIFIDPYTSESKNEYVVYFKSDYEKPAAAKKFFCGTEAQTSAHDVFEFPQELKTPAENNSLPGDCRLRTYRLALACTGEYAQFHGGTVERVLAAYNAAMTRVNGVYEKEAAITMKLIPNTDTLIFLNASTDPYSNNNGSTMLGQNQTTINARIGIANYDIGHVFSTGGGGIASLGSPCTNRKAQGVTGSATPVNDPFTIDYVAHEMGHQFGANHTQNNNCQRNSPTAMEPGSASTIMGYAGICNPNVQNNSHDYFHAISLNEIANFVVTGAGATCGTNVAIENSKPFVSVPRTSYSMPVSTAFYLWANGSDADGDALTYTWEQTDSQTATMPPQASNATGPAFRSLPPSSSPVRYFPDLLRRYNTWEVLPSVTRTMRFRCTVRDNNPLGGCTHEANVQLNFTTAAGPFVVSHPNTSQVDWKVGTRQTVTWDVANTDIAPVNCATVNILLSSDGGATYPDTLASGVPNDGSYEITVPNRTGTRTRVMVVANDHIFFDVSNFNFRISSSFNITSAAQKYDICDTEPVSVNLNITKSVTSEVGVALEALSEIHGLTFSFSEAETSAPAMVNLVIGGLENLQPGNNPIEIRATTDVEQIILTINLFKGLSEFPLQNLIAPASNTSNLSRFNVAFEWEIHPGISEYDVEIAQSPDFSGNIIRLKSTTGRVTFTLQDRTVFYWRVRGISPCGSGEYSKIRTFRTGSGAPAVLSENNLLLINPAEEAGITPKELKAAATPEDNVRFVVMQLPEHGDLIINNTTATDFGVIFTMQDILDGNVSYRHSGGDDEFDYFNFNLIDPNGLWLPDNTFRIRIRQQNLGIVAFRQNNVSCFGLADGAISIDAFGGTPPYLYSTDGIEYNESPSFNGLTAGMYTIFIKDTNDSIRVSDPISISQPGELFLGLSLIGYDIRATASGGSGGFSFSIDGSLPQNLNTFTDPGNGVHIIEAIDANGCTIVDTLEINIAPLTADLDGISILCYGDRVDYSVVASGGLPPYNYNVNEGVYQTSPLFKIPAGVFVFNVRDSGGKIVAADTLSISEPDEIVASAEVSRYDVIIMAEGGTGELMYAWEDTYLMLPDTFTLSENGNYSVIVRDDNECATVVSFSINVLNQINSEVSNVSCYGANDGVLNVEIPYGTPPYQITLSFNGESISGTENLYTGLKPGVYEISIIDALEDTASSLATIEEPEALTLTPEVENNQLTLIATGGTPPYRYSIDGGLFYVDFNTFIDLSDTTYHIFVSDNNSCIISDSVQIMTSSVFDIYATHQILITPNPGNGKYILRNRNNSLLTGQVTVYDLLGRMIYSASVPVTSGQFGEVVIDITSAQNGQYILRYTEKDKTSTVSLIKL